MGEYKPFSQELYDKNDMIAKLIAIEYYKRLGFKVVFGSKYGIDLIEKDFKFYVECSHIENWKKHYFCYKEVTIPERKRKCITGKTIFFNVNDPYTIAVLVKDEFVKEDSLREVSNKHKEKGEFFFHIPKELVEIVNISPYGEEIAEKYFRSIGRIS